MSTGKMHDDEIEVPVTLVRRLLAAQFPRWGELPMERVPSAGTDNAMFRLGDDLVVRLPRIPWAISQVEREHRWLPRLEPSLPLAIPTPLAKGTP
ncbi:MAG: phosphotransferase, partial [Actinomycetota bacterium]|nr:phosphotransferase [Actinomycetota bacterium]